MRSVDLPLLPDLLNKTLVTARGNIEELALQFKSVAENLNGTLNDLKPTLNNFKTLSDSLKQLRINQTLLKIQSTLAGVDGTLAKLRKGDNTAGKLLTDDALYVNINRLLLNMDSLVNHLNTNPNHFLAPLGKSAKKIERDRKKEGPGQKPAAQKK